MRVLLIEDDRMIGTAIEQVLKDAAYAVDWVTDGETAVHAAENESYELALLDLGLPKADGREVLRCVRTLGRRFPVIIVTARDAVDDRIDGLDLGADDYLVKPFEIRELLARMRAVLRHEGSGSPPSLSQSSLGWRSWPMSLLRVRRWRRARFGRRPAHWASNPSWSKSGMVRMSCPPYRDSKVALTRCMSLPIRWCSAVTPLDLRPTLADHVFKGNGIEV